MIQSPEIENSRSVKSKMPTKCSLIKKSIKSKFQSLSMKKSTKSKFDINQGLNNSLASYYKMKNDGLSDEDINKLKNGEEEKEEPKPQPEPSHVEIDNTYFVISTSCLILKLILLTIGIVSITFYYDKLIEAIVKNTYYKTNYDSTKDTILYRSINME